MLYLQIFSKWKCSGTSGRFSDYSQSQKKWAALIVLLAFTQMCQHVLIPIVKLANWYFADCEERERWLANWLFNRSGNCRLTQYKTNKISSINVSDRWSHIFNLLYLCCEKIESWVWDESLPHNLIPGPTVHYINASQHFFFPSRTCFNSFQGRLQSPNNKRIVGEPLPALFELLYTEHPRIERHAMRLIKAESAIGTKYKMQSAQNWPLPPCAWMRSLATQGPDFVCITAEPSAHPFILGQLFLSFGLDNERLRVCIVGRAAAIILCDKQRQKALSEWVKSPLSLWRPICTRRLRAACPPRTTTAKVSPWVPRCSHVRSSPERSLSSPLHVTWMRAKLIAVTRCPRRRIGDFWCSKMKH